MLINNRQSYWLFRLYSIALMSLAGVLAINALFFLTLTTDPLLVQDGWFYLDVFLSKAIHGHLTVADFFIRRSGFDHSQPLYKLIYLIELRHFRLDFTPQAVVGYFCSIGIAIISFFAVKADRDNRSQVILSWIGFAGLLVSVTSLNSTEIWTWPDVTMQYVSFLFAFLFFFMVARASGKANLVGVGLITLFLTIIASDTAVIAVGAVLAVFATKGIARWRANMPLGAVIVAVFIVSELVLYFCTPVIGGSVPSKGSGALLAQFTQSWKWVVLPLANSLVSLENLVHFVPTEVRFSQIILSCFLIIAHILFWRAFFKSDKSSRFAFPAFVMLFFYGLVAGIVVGRVGYFGSDYLNSPRYVLYYQFNLIALISMYVACFSSRNFSVNKSYLFGLISLTAWFFVQLPLSRSAWASAPYHRLAYVRIAEQIEAIRKRPDVTPPECAPELPPCRMVESERVRLIGLIYANKLNLYSGEFQAMHGLVGTMRGGNVESP